MLRVRRMPISVAMMTVATPPKIVTV